MSLKPQVINAKTLQMIMGTIACSLPFVLVITVYILGDNTPYQPSISDFFFTKAKVPFIGSLWAVGMFMFAYKGYLDNKRISDNAISNVLGFCAIAIAVFPTDPENADLSTIGILHLVFAGTFFIILGYMSYFRFTLSNQALGSLKAPKIRRNFVYKLCGILLFLSLLCMVIYLILESLEVIPVFKHVIFWCETAGLLAFGVSWLTKAELIFPDLD